LSKKQALFLTDIFHAKQAFSSKKNTFSSEKIKNRKFDLFFKERMLVLAKLAHKLPFTVCYC
jgi:hypothetical protein